MDRQYDWSCFSRDSLYGVPTPHDNSGSGVKSALDWSAKRSVTPVCDHTHLIITLAKGTLHLNKLMISENALSHN